MSIFKTKTLSILNDIKGKGSFVSHHIADFQFPGVEVRGVGEISYPINEAQAKALINIARKAPFGKGKPFWIPMCEVPGNWMPQTLNLTALDGTASE